MKNTHGKAPTPPWMTPEPQIIRAPKPNIHGVCRSCGKRTYLDGETRTCKESISCFRRVERKLAKKNR